MASGTAKAALFDALASVAQALGSGRRAEIVDVLAQGERSVEEIAGEISQSVANTSQHLQVLARAGLVRSRREGTRIIYRLASERVGGAVGGCPRRGGPARGRGVGARRRVSGRARRGGAALGRRARAAARAWRRGRARRAPGGRVPRRSHRGLASRRRCRRSRSLQRSCRSGARSSPTAAAPTACTPTTPSGCFESGG